MPFQAVAWAWKVPALCPVERCALLYLANMADEYGIAYEVSVVDIEAFSGAGAREVAHALVGLEERGLIQTTDRPRAYAVALPIRVEWIVDGSINRAPIAEADRAAVFSESAGRCFACQSPDDPHVDHIVPRAKGGSNARENLQVLCAVCNGRKSFRTGWVSR